MALNLASVLPNSNGSLNGACFIFGAGASVEAGYPMMPALTRSVVAQLSTTSRSILDEVLTASGKTYDDVAARPNIEELSDLIMTHALNSQMVSHKELEERIKELIINELLAIRNPNLESHVKFLEALKRRVFGERATIWIITTNYDLLFETAAAYARIALVNGFCGTTVRYFDPSVFEHVIGTAEGNHFVPGRDLTIKMIKLHGSLSWFAEGNHLFEMHPDGMPRTLARTMVLPRRRKIMDTLAFPYDQLFTKASRLIGNECRYLASCGYSYGDDHVNQNVIIPALKSGRARLMALCQEEPTGIASFKQLPTFNACFESAAVEKGVAASAITDCWKFSKFVELF